MKKNLKIRIAIEKARELLEEVGYTQPKDFTLDELIWYSGGIPKTELLDNCSGRIVFGENKATITVNEKILFQPKVNFIKAHELGHLLLHKKLSRNFFDTDKTLSQWLANGGHEIEANAFASELLMPSDLFKKIIDKQRIDSFLLDKCTKFFGVSKTAFFLKYVEYGAYPIAIVFSEKGFIKWVNITEDFVLKFIKIGTKVPYNTVTMEVLKGNDAPIEPEIVEAISWFPDDFDISRFKNWSFKELCFKTGPDSILTCIWEL
jgi:Zn-dependent peptidase ImmA (M78 family)